MAAPASCHCFSISTRLPGLLKPPYTLPLPSSALSCVGSKAHGFRIHAKLGENALSFNCCCFPAMDDEWLFCCWCQGEMVKPRKEGRRSSLPAKKSPNSWEKFPPFSLSFSSFPTPIYIRIGWHECVVWKFRYWQTAGEREGENPMMTPLPYIIIFGMSTPFVILAIAFANGWIKVPVRWTWSTGIVASVLELELLTLSSIRSVEGSGYHEFDFIVTTSAKQFCIDMPNFVPRDHMNLQWRRKRKQKFSFP